MLKISTFCTTHVIQGLCCFADSSVANNYYPAMAVLTLVGLWLSQLQALKHMFYHIVPSTLISCIFCTLYGMCSVSCMLYGKCISVVSLCLHSDWWHNRCLTGKQHALHAQSVPYISYVILNELVNHLILTAKRTVKFYGV